MDIIQANYRFWNWSSLSCNLFEKDVIQMKKTKQKLIRSNSTFVKFEWLRLIDDNYYYEIRALADAMNLKVYPKSTMIELIAIKIWLYEKQGIPF